MLKNDTCAEKVVPRIQCSQPSRADGRALAGYSPGRPGQGGYGRPGKASVFHKDGSPMG